MSDTDLIASQREAITRLQAELHTEKHQHIAAIEHIDDLDAAIESLEAENKAQAKLIDELTKQIGLLRR